MKYTLTDLNDANEPIIFSNSRLGNYCFDYFFGNLIVDSSPFIDMRNQYEILHSTYITVTIYINSISTFANLFPYLLNFDVNKIYCLYSLMAPRQVRLQELDIFSEILRETHILWLLLWSFNAQ